MKKCPGCNAEIPVGALFCPQCGMALAGAQPPRPWYFKDGTVITSLLMLLALALPLVWFSPYYSRRNKIIFTVVIGLLTWATWVFTAQALQSLESYYKFAM